MKPLRLLPPVLLTLALGACLSVPTPRPEVYYHIEPPPPPALGALDTRILIEPFVTPGVYSERPLLWARGSALQQYHRHFWAEAPGQELHAALVDTLRAAGAKEVYAPFSRVAGDVAVRTRIRHLELQTEGGPRAVLELEFFVGDAAGRPLHSLIFKRERELAESTPELYVQAVSAMAGEAFAELAGVLWKLPAPAAQAGAEK